MRIGVSLGASLVHLRRAVWYSIVGVSLVGVAACDEDEALARRNSITHAVGASVQLFSEREDGVRRAGSGVILRVGHGNDVTHVLTTAHFLEPLVDQRVYVVSPLSPDRVEADIVATDADADLALIDVLNVDGAAVHLAVGAQLTDPIWVVGYPWGRDRTVVNGAVSRIEAAADSEEPIPIWGYVTLIDASVSYGMSGIFDRHTGDLLGLVRGYRTANLTLSSDAPPLSIPVAGETTVIPTTKVACFLKGVEIIQLRDIAGIDSFGADDCPSE
jgi:S1-C subfamily serine protease